MIKFSLRSSLVVILFCTNFLRGEHAWETPGCHKVGHTRRISIPECVEFDITTNACRGFCESWAIPASWNQMADSLRRRVTSIGQCCNIMDTEDVKVKVMCLEGPRELLFKSARTCSCFHCKKY
ncbi:UNVERIFIED_CONTAM: hypothetical protein RMT77_000889 [Armadillidium vulgare]